MPLVYSPSVETLHSLLLLSWCEYGSGRENGLSLYSSVRLVLYYINFNSSANLQLSVRMAMELGLGNEETIQSLPTDHERMDLRQTWWSVVFLDITSSWGMHIFSASYSIPDIISY